MGQYIYTHTYTRTFKQNCHSTSKAINKKISDTQWRSFEILPSNWNQLFFSVNFRWIIFIVQIYIDVYIRACKIEKLLVYSFFFSFVHLLFHLFFCPFSFWHLKFSDIYICFFFIFLWTFASHSKLILSFNVPQTTPRITNKIHWSVRLRLPTCLRARRSGLKCLLASPSMSLHASIHSWSFTWSLYSPACLCFFMKLDRWKLTAVSLQF